MRALAVVFVLAIVASFAIARGVEMWRAARPPDEPVHALPTPQPPDTPAVAIDGPACPALPKWELFDGELAGLARATPGGPARLVGSVPGSRPLGPDPLAALTVVGSGGSRLASGFERTAEPGTPPALALHVPLTGPADDRVVLLTSACLPNRAARGQGWSYLDAEPLAPGHARALLTVLSERLVRHWSVPGSLLGPHDDRLPTRLGVLPIRLFGCRQLVVFNDHHGRKLLPSEHWSGLFCIDADGTVSRSPVPLAPGVIVTAVLVVDVDADGSDEIVVTRRDFDAHGLHDARDELLWYDDVGDLHAEVLLRSP